MLGDILVFRTSSAQGGRGSDSINVAASASIINAGEPVLLVAGASSAVVNQSTNLLVINASTPYSVSGTGLLGIAETNSTNTTTLVGSVDYIPATSGTTWLINANTSASVATQALYDALVGHRTLIDLTSGKYTMLTTDSALNGCVIQPLNVFKNPGKIAFKFIDAVYAWS